MSKVLLDTDIFSEIIKAKDAVVIARTQMYLQQHIQLTISSITAMEIVKGLYKRGDVLILQRFQAALRTVEELAFDAHCSELAGRIYADLERSGQTIGIADVMIASIAIKNQLLLVTGNQRHYKRIQQLGYALDLDNWRSISQKI